MVMALMLVLGGCDVSMTQQQRDDRYAAAALWPNGATAQPLPEHVVAQGDLARDRESTEPPPASPALLARGRERFDIYCSPCHGLDGKGDGIVAARGFPHPPSFVEPRLLAAPASNFTTPSARATASCIRMPRASSRATVGRPLPISVRCNCRRTQPSHRCRMRGRSCHEPASPHLVARCCDRGGCGG